MDSRNGGNAPLVVVVVCFCPWNKLKKEMNMFKSIQKVWVAISPLNFQASFDPWRFYPRTGGNLIKSPS